MKTNCEKLYGKAPPNVLGTLAAGAFIKGDTDELHRVYSAIHSMSGNSMLRFHRQQSALMTTILLWVIDCKDTYSKILETAIFQSGVSIGEVNTKEATAANFIREAMQRRLSSLIVAMQEICRRNGIEFDDVSCLAGIDGMALREDVPAIPKLVEELIEQYRR